MANRSPPDVQSARTMDTMRSKQATLGLPSLLVSALLLLPTQTQAQEDEVSDQVWANFIMGRPISDKLYFEYDVEGAKQVSGGEPWAYIYGTALTEYYPNKWIDLTGELVTGFTEQTSTEDSFELTGRAGIRLHFIAQIFNSPTFKKIRSERLSGKRFNIATLLRIERRHFWYSDNVPDSDDWRFRSRLETQLALNKPSLGTDGVWNLLADIEWFVPLDDEEAPQRFATKRRIRLGVGYRHSYKWRFDVLAMTDKARDTLEGEVDVESRMIDFRIKRFF